MIKTDMIEVDQFSVARLNKTIAAASKQTRRSVDQSVVWGGVTVAESIRARAKPSRKNREVIDNPEWKQAKGSFAWARKQLKAGKSIPAEAKAALDKANAITPFLIVVLRQDPKPARHIGAYERTDPRRVIENRGLARRVSNVMVAKIADIKSVSEERTVRITEGDVMVSKRTARYGEKSIDISLRMINRLPYMTKAYPGIVGQAVQSAANRMEHKLQAEVAKAVQKANAA